MTYTYENSLLPSSAFPHLFVIEDPPAAMLAKIGWRCYLQCNNRKSKAAVAGVPVFEEMNGHKFTDKPRVFEVAGLQYNFKRDLCYRLHGSDDPVGRCAGVDEVIFIDEES